MNFNLKFTNNTKPINPGILTYAGIPLNTGILTYAELPINTESPTTNTGIYKIPKIVHQTFITRYLPLDIINIVNHNKRVCPDCEFKFYDDNDCENFIKNNFEEEIYLAYKSINDVYGAMKADFFRYCVLYIIGGIYIDIKSKINYPLFKLIHPDDSCLLDKPRNNFEPWRRHSPTYEQWILIFAPNHPYLLSMIELMVGYIKTKHEPKIENYKFLNSKQKILHITGPDAFTKAVNYTIKKNKKILHRTINYDKYFLIKSTNYIKMYQINNKKHYSEYREPLYK